VLNFDLWRFGVRGYGGPGRPAGLIPRARKAAEGRKRKTEMEKENGMEDKVLIDRPGKYPMRNGGVAEVLRINMTSEYPAKGRDPLTSWRLDGCAYKLLETPTDIVGPRIPEPDAQVRIPGTEDLDGRGGIQNEGTDLVPPNPTAMERYAAYAEKHRPDIVVLQVRPWTSGKYLAKCWRNDSDGILIVETNRHANTPEAALAAAMDVLEGLA
jgi:hypothetical protein